MNNVQKEFEDAVASGKLELVKLYVENGADVKANDNLAVIYASFCGNLELVEYLHSKGADIFACNNSAIQCAFQNMHSDVVEYLGLNGAIL